MRTSENSIFDVYRVASEIAFWPIHGSRSHILCMEGYQWLAWIVHSSRFPQCRRVSSLGVCGRRPTTNRGGFA